MHQSFVPSGECVGPYVSEVVRLLCNWNWGKYQSWRNLILQFFNAVLSIAELVTSSVALQQVMYSALRRAVLCRRRTEYWRAGDVIGRCTASDVVRCTARSPVLSQD